MLRTVGALPATAPLARALLEWAEPHRLWLMPDHDGEWRWEALIAGLAAPRADGVRAEALELAGTALIHPSRIRRQTPRDPAALHHEQSLTNSSHSRRNRAIVALRA